MSFLRLLFRRDPRSGPFALHASMAGLKMGDRLLQVGCGDGQLFATLGVSLGLTGRACAVDVDEAAAERARAVALEAGVLAEVAVAPYTAIPFENDAFDLVVIQTALSAMSPEARVGCLQEALRTARPGGRCLVIEPGRRGGLGGLLQRQRHDPHYTTGGGTAGALGAEGFKGARLLADRAGHAFFEAAKPRRR